jgi:hypothetical protein
MAPLFSTDKRYFYSITRYFSYNFNIKAMNSNPFTSSRGVAEWRCSYLLRHEGQILDNFKIFLSIKIVLDSMLYETLNLPQIAPVCISSKIIKYTSKSRWICINPREDSLSFFLVELTQVFKRLSTSQRLNDLSAVALATGMFSKTHNIVSTCPRLHHFASRRK